MAIGRSRPAFTSGSVEVRLLTSNCVSPLTIAVSAGALPLYGICVMSMPAASFNMRPARCPGVPLPDDAKFN